MYGGNDTPERTEGMMSLKQSDFVAMSCIAAGVVFPFALLGAYNTVQARSAETEWALHTDAAQRCEAEVVEAEPTRVIVVLRRDQEPITVVGHKVTVTEISSEVERIRVTAQELHLRATQQERLRAIAEAVQARNNVIHQAVIEVQIGAKSEAARMGLLAEELRALERRIQMERMTDTKGIEARAAERYQVVMEQLRATLEAEGAQASADDQHKKRRRHTRKKRRPC